MALNEMEVVMGIEKDENLPYMVIPIEMEDGSEVECEVLAIFPVDGKQYIALVDKDNDDSDIWMYRFVPVGEEEFNIEDIEDDKEFEKVEDAFNQMVEAAEIDAVIDEKE
ncbi:hypothetical protein GCWU000282_01402 [Catonella morbi ATCC 51271]|uniref:Uncharacterized protein n=1 Tax=Catonella morbi ATCC 51271 TaxID=592026 RepID=V2Y5P3_9FIRM|nr:DUF1292 domain-containing protein [Catonella morbi]ESL03412.1 hypothetical protein GCWU000282_01402 [Catonella morbi ATCC 51271]